MKICSVEASQADTCRQMDGQTDRHTEVNRHCTTIIQQDVAVRSQFYFTAALLYMFRVFSTPIIRSTLTVSTASGTGHTSVQVPSSVAKFELSRRKVAAPMYDLYQRL